jgi:hypothetical protein
MEEKQNFAVMVEGRQTPTRLYDNFSDAEREAIRLAQKERQTTYVLKAVAKYELNDIKKTEL